MANKPMVNLTRLEELMREKSWGVGELATYSGVKYDTVYSLKKGRRLNTSASTLKAIAETLGTTVDYLLGESDDRTPEVERLPQPIQQLAQIAANLSNVRQEELIRIATALAELEREQANRPLPSGAMRALVELSERLKGDGTNEDLLVLLQALLQNPPPRWLIDLRPGGEPPNQPVHSE